MRVIEKGADRTAQVYVHVKGRVTPSEEYGQYIDADDGALCCYVAVEEGQNIKVDGRFSGVTLTVAYDFLVDGVCRKSNTSTAKSVQVLKNKKLEVEQFLYQTPDGPIDTEILVTPHTGPVILSKDTPETIGTLELRVYITRQFGVEHKTDTYKYDKAAETTDTGPQTAAYKEVPPQYRMTPETNCATLDKTSGNREKKKLYAKRPGLEPWAIFRFHYRSKESILERGMPLTFDAEDKAFAKIDPHALELEPVPMLMIGSKPASKNDADSSVRTSSPAPSNTPSTPIKSAKQPRNPQPKAVIKKQPTKSTPTTTSSKKMMSTTDAEHTSVVDSLNDDLFDMSNSWDPQSTPTHLKDKSTPTDGKLADSTAIASKNDSAASVPAKTTKEVTKKASPSTDVLSTDSKNKDFVKNAVAKTDDKEDFEVVDVTTQVPFLDTFNVPTIPTFAESTAVTDASAAASSSAMESISVSNLKDFVKTGSQRFVSPFRKGATKPMDPPAITIPMKRAPEGTLTPPLDVKRISMDSVPPLTPTHILRQPSASPSPRSMSMETEVAEQRKRLNAARKNRVRKAEQKAALDEKLAPYKQRMADELERLRQEIADEEMMAAEFEEDCNTSKALLDEYMRADVDGVE